MGNEINIGNEVVWPAIYVMYMADDICIEYSHLP